ncbi:hypothetical protein GCM10011289_31900 [Paludibacterium paludis]|uniref:Uncharacterized protein n=2 Tax=Paludibacterium paludis TaxID=1225769 RepID=A0A918P6E5_9NEIS|nr:hypothetical protein GCM10011289_31900 [Paludibacterium paludis]
MMLGHGIATATNTENRQTFIPNRQETPTEPRSATQQSLLSTADYNQLKNHPAETIKTWSKSKPDQVTSLLQNGLRQAINTHDEGFVRNIIGNSQARNRLGSGMNDTTLTKKNEFYGELLSLAVSASTRPGGNAKVVEALLSMKHFTRHLNVSDYTEALRQATSETQRASATTIGALLNTGKIRLVSASGKRVDPRRHLDNAPLLNQVATAVHDVAPQDPRLLGALTKFAAMNHLTARQYGELLSNEVPLTQSTTPNGPHWIEYLSKKPVDDSSLAKSLNMAITQNNEAVFQQLLRNGTLGQLDVKGTQSVLALLIRSESPRAPDWLAAFEKAANVTSAQYADLSLALLDKASPAIQRYVLNTHASLPGAGKRLLNRFKGSDDHKAALRNALINDLPLWVDREMQSQGFTEPLQNKIATLYPALGKGKVLSRLLQLEARKPVGNRDQALVDFLIKSAGTLGKDQPLTSSGTVARTNLVNRYETSTDSVVHEGFPANG